MERFLEEARRLHALKHPTIPLQEKAVKKTGHTLLVYKNPADRPKGRKLTFGSVD